MDAKDTGLVSAEDARGCGDGGCVFRPPSDKGQHTNAGCRCLPLRMTPAERVGLREQIRSLVVELDGARKRLEGVGVVECLAARDAATRERERANKAERDLLRRLWHRIDGDQDGDAPSAVEMEDGLVRLFDDMRADVERCAADENASTEEAERLREECDRLRDVVEHAARTGSDATFRVAVCKGAGSGEKLALVVTGPADREESMARSVGGIICATMSLAMDERDVELRDAVAERDRLAREVERLERALRVENGDPFAGPDGWTPTTRGWRRADMLVTRRWMFGTCVRVALDEDGHIIDGPATDHPNAWDAMTQFGDEEAADAAREVTRG